MSILSTIIDKVFHHPAARAGEQAPNSPMPQSPATAPTDVDVNAVLSEMASKNSEKLNWQTSIVDLMKLLGLDSGLTARKSLAKELGYSEDTADSAAMNVWLQSQVMKRFADNGGRVPKELLH